MTPDQACLLPATGSGLSIAVAAVIVFAAGAVLLAVGRRRPVAMAVLLVSGVLAVNAPAEAADDCPPATTAATTRASTSPTTTVTVAAVTQARPTSTGASTAASIAETSSSTAATVPESTSTTASETTTSTTTSSTPATTEPAPPPVAIGDSISVRGDVGDVVRVSFVANDLNATPLTQMTVIEFEGVNDADCDGVFFLTATGQADVTVLAPATCRYQYSIETPAGQSGTANVIIFIGVFI